MSKFSKPYTIVFSKKPNSRLCIKRQTGRTNKYQNQCRTKTLDKSNTTEILAEKNPITPSSPKKEDQQSYSNLFLFKLQEIFDTRFRALLTNKYFILKKQSRRIFPKFVKTIMPNCKTNINFVNTIYKLTRAHTLNDA